MKNKMIATLIVILVLIIIVIGIYKINLNHKPVNNAKKEKITYELKNYISDEINETVDEIKYKDNIIYENLLSIDFNFYHESKSITGKFYIDENKLLHIVDKTNNETDIIISNNKFKTMYTKEFVYDSGIFIYLLTEDGKLFEAELTSNNIKNVKLIDFFLNYKIKNFVNLNFKTDVSPSAIGLLVLADDGNIYDVFTGIRYTENLTSLFDMIYVTNDNKIINRYGKILENNEQQYKIKYVYMNYDSTESAEILIVTEDNKLLVHNYLKENFVEEYVSKVKNLSFDVEYPFEVSNLRIEFENNEKKEFKAACSIFYCSSPLKTD